MFPESFILNYKHYTRESLLKFAVEKINAPGSAGPQGTQGATGTEETDNTPHVSGWEKELYQFISDLLNEEKTLVQQTSGTTGEPKSFVLKRDAMLVSAQRTLDHFGIKTGDSALLCLPVQYIAGKMMVVRALAGGLNLVTIEPTGNPGNALLQQGLRVVFAAMVPLQVYELLKTPEAFRKIGTLIVGGGEIDPGVRKKIQKLDGIKIYETFAMSETYTHFATRRLNESASENSSIEMKRTGGDASISEEKKTGVDVKVHEQEQSLKNAKVSDMKKAGKDMNIPPGKSTEVPCKQSFQVMEGVIVELDERGCLVVDIPGVTDGPVVSNDLAEITGPRSFRWLGRLDNVIKTGGIKVIPETIEGVVKELTGRNVVVLGVPDRRLGQKLVLVVEGAGKETASSTHAGPLHPDHIIEALKTRLAAHEVPKEIRFLPEFPRNRSMKIDRKEIRRRVDMG